MNSHKNPYIHNKNIVEWIKPTIQHEAKFYNVDIEGLTDKQIALVVRALRMHTLMVWASNYDRTELGEKDKETSFYPIETSIGRFLRDSAEVVLDE